MQLKNFIISFLAVFITLSIVGICLYNHTKNKDNSDMTTTIAAVENTEETVTKEPEPVQESEPEQEQETEPAKDDTLYFKAIHSSGDLNLRAEPNTDCEILYRLQTGDEGIVLDTDENWAKVTYTKDGQSYTGYVNIKYVEVFNK